MFGSDGSQVSFAVIIPDVIVALGKVVRGADIAAARRSHETIYPLAKTIYGDSPGSGATARLKVWLQLLDRTSNAIVRSPGGPLSSVEISKFNHMLSEIELREEAAQFCVFLEQGLQAPRHFARFSISQHGFVDLYDRCDRRRRRGEECLVRAIGKIP